MALRPKISAKKRWMPVGALKASAEPPGVETVPDTGTVAAGDPLLLLPPPPHADIAPASTHTEKQIASFFITSLLFFAV
jgi:hypothetical protein